MLVDVQSPCYEVKGVVDWDMCTVGDPFYELTILLSYWGSTQDSSVYAFQCRMPKEADGWWSRDKVIHEYLSLTGFSLNEKDLNFYWWLTQYRTIVVYAQLNAMFERTGDYPAALSKEDCDMMAQRVDLLIDDVACSVGMSVLSLNLQTGGEE